MARGGWQRARVIEHGGVGGAPPAGLLAGLLRSPEGGRGSVEVARGGVDRLSRGRTAVASDSGHLPNLR
ncbi:hypothetical protein GUJ93_ZPchr0002g25634 [Zizania palustris]|uniref:Uncharacterized protein n=1 Tax=Zizania palustris TaxID=103762 RepID=A0A8J5RYX7_ZIZPA|nr:hypothetical protein GUJ93_ZPchr0002g25634 [Zizania palustris]